MIVLFALFVNIAHDAVIAIGDRHVSEPVFEYVLEQDKPSFCGHMGEYHSLFHFAAIITPAVARIEKSEKTKPLVMNKPVHFISFFQTTIKPPIV